MDHAILWNHICLTQILLKTISAKLVDYIMETKPILRMPTIAEQ